MGTLELLRAAGVGPGDEVIAPAFGNVEVAESIVHAGALPVFADVDPASYCLDPDSVAAAITPRTAAVVAVRRFGRPADLARLRALGERHGLLVLEHRDPEAVHDAAPGASHHAMAQRRAHAALLDLRLTGVLVPEPCPGHTYQQYVVRVPGNGRPDRDAFARALRGKGVNCKVPVKTPVHRLPQFRRDIHLPHTERAADETLALPVHAALHTRDVRRIIATCNTLGGLLQPA